MSSRCQTSPPFANAPTRAVKPAKTACITASTVTDIRKLVMETLYSRRGSRPLNRPTPSFDQVDNALLTLPSLSFAFHVYPCCTSQQGSPEVS